MDAHKNNLTPEPYLAEFSLESPEILVRTPRAVLWRVDAPEGAAVLKVLTKRGLDAGDMIGARLLELWNGQGAARLYHQSPHAQVMEHLPGPSLADALRSSDDADKKAAEIIANLSVKLRLPKTDGFIDLWDHFGGALHRCDPDVFPAELRAAFGRAQAMWFGVMETTTEPCLLHGDLNYDNVIRSDRGWLVIDPKGIISDPAYEFGVVFRNPVDEPDRICEPARVTTLAQTLADHSGLKAERILQFGFVHVAMSLAYHYRRTGGFAPADLALFQTFDALNLPVPA